MSILLYSTSTGVARQRLEETIGALTEVDIVDDSVELRRRLFRPQTFPAIAVLQTAKTADLDEILKWKECLSQIDLVLVLPDMNPETLAKAHRLRPRFISHVEGDFTSLAAVLEKMLRQNVL